jgi:hypothetical protein
MGVAFFGVSSSNLSGTFVVCVSSTGLGAGEAEFGKAPGISSLSGRDKSLTGAVRGVRMGASCDKDTRFGVDEFLLRIRAELRRAIVDCSPLLCKAV